MKLFRMKAAGQYISLFTDEWFWTRSGAKKAWENSFPPGCAYEGYGFGLRYEIEEKPCTLFEWFLA